MPLSAEQIKAVQDKIRAGDIRDAQGMLLELQHTVETEELDAQIAAGNPPPPPTKIDSLNALLAAIVADLGSKPTMVHHLAALQAAPVETTIVPATAEDIKNFDNLPVN